MTQIGHFLCLLLGCLIGHLIVYIARGIWNFLTEKRVEIPEIKYDVADNPILSLKNRLGQAYVASHDQTVKKLLHRLLEYVEVIEEWHKAKIHLAETECATYKTRAARLNVELEIERSKNAELEKQLKEEREKNKIPIFSDQTEVPAYLINENTFGGQTNSFAKIILNTKPGEPLTATEATELAERLMNMTSKPIVMDSETLNETQTKNEEFIKQLRDWWGLEAQKAVELPKDEPPIYSEEFYKKLREIWFGVDNDTEWHQYSVTVRKNGDCKEKKIIVLARSSIEAASLVPSGYTVENISKLFE